MQTKLASMITIALCSVALTGCKKKAATGTESGSAAPGSGSATGSAGSAVMGSGSATGTAGSAADPSSGSSAAAGSGSGSGSAAAAGDGGCSATAYRSTTGAFCIELPKDAKATETKNNDELIVAFEDPATTHTFSVTVRPDEDHGSYTSAIDGFGVTAKDPNNTVLETFDFTGGVTGKMLVYTIKDRANAVQIFATVKGNKHIYGCGGENQDLKTDLPWVPNACKTLRPTD